MRMAKSDKKLPEILICCQIGLERQQFEPNLKLNLDKYDIGGTHSDFIVTPLVSPMSLQSNTLSQIKVVTDLRLRDIDWRSKVAVSISYQPTSTSESREIFRILLQHALYLPAKAIIIDCPECPESQKAVALMVNENLKHNYGRSLVLFRIKLLDRRYKKEEMRNFGLRRARVASHSVEVKSNDRFNNRSINPIGREIFNEPILGYRRPVFMDDWACWNSFRKHLKPDTRLGVCLTVNNEIDFSHKPLERWFGEPVRMISLGFDRFVSQTGCEGSTRLVGSLREFVRSILIANSFKTCLVAQEAPFIEMRMYLKYLGDLRALIDDQNPDYLRPWNDLLMLPLQPLSTNLDSKTYRMLELDDCRYEKYQEAMKKGIKYLIERPESRTRFQFYLMVLGAGRGCLVDAMIRAIKSIRSKERFKIYALDKNYSSVQAMNERLANRWLSSSNLIDVEVVWADMRSWIPKEKADLIATDLLGSFSDNELSPECIDGTWRFCTSETISIPQSYTSYIAPISSFRMHQELDANANLQERPFDRIYMVRLMNFYPISAAQPLFTFEHKELDKEPEKGTNLREGHLSFVTTVDTVCHGFIGYFSARLFGTTSISNLPTFNRTIMDRWFPAFIPLEEPVEMVADTTLKLSFFRKENDTHVWYEWYTTKPKISRVHSLEGDKSAMSKSVKK